MVRIKKMLVTAVTVAMMLSFAGCSGMSGSAELPDDTEAPSAFAEAEDENITTVADGGTVDISVGPYDTLNPLTTSNEDIRIYTGLIYENLVRIDEVLEPQPALFASWEHSEDYKVWEFTLREGVKFHDGTAVNAESVKTLIDYIETNGGNYAENIKDIAGCFVKDELTVQFVLDVSDSSMVSKLSIPLLSPATLSGDKSDSSPVGAGMYSYVSKEGNIITLKRYEEYYCAERKPHIENVKITVYCSEYEKYGSDFDFALFYGTNTAAYVFDEKTTVYSYTGKNCSYLAVNCNAAYAVAGEDPNTPGEIIYTGISNAFADPKVRQAVSLLLDREKICDAAAGNGGSAVLLPSYRGTVYWNNKYNVQDADEDEARRLLAEAGYSKSEVDGFWYYSDGTALIVDAISMLDNFEVRIIMRNVKSCLEAVGIQVNLEELSDEEFAERLLNGRYMLTPMQIDLGCWIDIEKIFKTGGEFNCSFYSNATVDSYLAQIRLLEDKSVISAGYNAIETILLQDNPVYGLYISGDSVAVRDSLTGVKRGSFYSWDPLANFYQWGIAEDTDAQADE